MKDSKFESAVHLGHWWSLFVVLRTAKQERTLVLPKGCRHRLAYSRIGETDQEDSRLVVEVHNTPEMNVPHS